MKERLAMILFALVLGSVLTVVLIVVDSATLPVIRKNEDLQAKSGVLQALGLDAGSADVEKEFAADVTERSSGGLTYYVSRAGDVAFAFKGSGLWGPIEGVIALSPDMRKIERVIVLRQEETPGLGSRIADQEYLKRYEGRAFTPALRLVAAGRASGPTDVEAITGATMTSSAFVGILNSELSRFAGSVKGGTR
jgi:Na+-transporting NADH:ubiquinone oxidoreductase subunit C